MGLVSTVGKFLSGGNISEPIDSIGRIIDEVYTNPEEKLEKQALLERIRQKPGFVQAEINKVEAQHRSRFVAGWRPFIGWVCGTALAYNFILRDLIAWGIAITNTVVESPPELAMEHLMTVLLGLLGLGGMRTYEKVKRVSK